MLRIIFKMIIGKDILKFNNDYRKEQGFDIVSGLLEHFTIEIELFNEHLR